MSIESLRALYRRIYVLGAYWGQYRESWLQSESRHGNERTLDAGCGQGEVFAEFVRYGVPVDYYGVDLGVGDPSWQFKVSAVADLHRLPFKNSSFDKTICNQVLEHVDQPEVVFKELVRVLRIGGKAYFSLPFVWHLHQQPYDRFRFTLDGIRYLAAKHGMKVNVIQPMGGFFSVFRYLITSHGMVSESWPSYLKWITRISMFTMKWFDRFIGAPLFFLLDKLDHDPKLTLGYFLCLQKEGVQSNQGLPPDPYCCPVCAPMGNLQKREKEWVCDQCKQGYEIISGVPVLTPPGAYKPVTKRIEGNHGLASTK